MTQKIDKKFCSTKKNRFKKCISRLKIKKNRLKNWVKNSIKFNVSIKRIGSKKKQSKKSIQKFHQKIQFKNSVQKKTPKVVVWAVISSEGIIDPYFFENGPGRTQTVNSGRYCHMIRTFLLQKCKISLATTATPPFQQDGATSHGTKTQRVALHDLFHGSVLSRRRVINWPPTSPDLTPADFFLWG